MVVRHTRVVSREWLRNWYIVTGGESIPSDEICAIPEGEEYITLDTVIEGKLHVEGKHKIIE